MYLFVLTERDRRISSLRISIGLRYPQQMRALKHYVVFSALMCREERCHTEIVRLEILLPLCIRTNAYTACNLVADTFPDILRLELDFCMQLYETV